MSAGIRCVVSIAAASATLMLWLAVSKAPAAADTTARRVYPKRWVYVSRSLRSDRDVEDIRNIVRTAAEHGLNGMVLAGGLDHVDIQPPEFFARLKQVKSVCDEYKVEIIPTGFNVGYGGSLLAHDPNLAEGMPVKNALYLVHGGEAHFQPDSPSSVVNGGFEHHRAKGLDGFTTIGAFGESIFIDNTVTHDGAASVRFDGYGAHGGTARIEQTIPVVPDREYRVRAWIRTEGVAPATLFSINAFAPDGRNLSYFEPNLAATSDWHQVTAGFNSWYADKVRLSAGVDEGRSGRLWLDGITIEEVGLVNVVRRSGTPVQVKNEKNGAVYTEGSDYARIVDNRSDFRFAHPSPAIRLLPGSRIKDGDRLRVDYYHGLTIYRDQVPACISDARVMEIWRRQFPILQRELAPKTYLLALDEIRMGGTCEDCRRRKQNSSMARILGEYATNLDKMIRAQNPGAEVFVWSDMFDPNHNSRPRYYLVDGDFTGSWKYLPKDMEIACWYYEKRRASLDFFSKLGFKTLGAAYYDADDLTNPAGWLAALDSTPGAVGIMYTTWENKYKLLPAFGDLVTKR